MSWNKGLTKETDQRVLKSSINKKGKGGDKSKIRHLKNRIERLGEYYNIINTPEAWKITCTNCEINEIKYIRFDTYYRRKMKKLAGEDIKCGSCRQIGKVFSDELKQKLSISAKNRKIDPENEMRRRQGTSAGLKKYHANMTPEEKIEYGKKIVHGQWNKPQHEIDAWIKKRSDKRKEEMLRLGTNDTFTPSYNKQTIDYIDTTLNIKFNIEFKHAENGGEFKVYDKTQQRFYYADAYSPELNLWVEFDEENKFSKDNLKPEHLKRHQLIKELVGCDIIRYKVVKNKEINDYEFVEYLVE